MSDLKLTNDQTRALALVRWLVGRISDDVLVGIWRGYAGTGKTTCLKEVIEEHGVPILLAPTGKAALRLSEATGETAKTLHRWLYQTREDEKTGKLIFAPKPLEELLIPENKLIVVDEASMIGRDLWKDLLDAAAYTECNILLVGDHFQLPPVEPGEQTPFSVLVDDFPCAQRADMTEIVRQALDNPIVRSSLALRNGDVDAVQRDLKSVSGKDEVWNIVKGFYDTAGAGSVLCFTNKLRHALNGSARSRRGLTGAVQKGEPLLVLKNTYELDVFNGEVLTFGGFSKMGTGVVAQNTFPPHQEAPATYGVTSINKVATVLSPEGVEGKLQGFSRKAMSQAARESLGVYFPPPPPSKGKVRSFTPVLEANFGYTLTVHKSQGSEWDRVLVVVEPQVPLGTEEGRRWLYTAITRARTEAFLHWS